jgi:hypothetical protein
MNDNVEYPRVCATCGRTYRHEHAWMEHVRMGHAISTCGCGGKRIKMTLPDPTSRTGPHPEYRTVRFCPKCRTAVHWTSRGTGLPHDVPVEGEDLARLTKQYDSVAARMGGGHA